jgi:hypothetical protein
VKVSSGVCSRYKALVPFSAAFPLGYLLGKMYFFGRIHIRFWEPFAWEDPFEGSDGRSAHSLDAFIWEGYLLGKIYFTLDTTNLCKNGRQSQSSYLPGYSNPFECPGSAPLTTSQLSSSR